MRICFLTQNLNTKDGGGRFSHDFVSNLRNQGVEVVVLTREKGEFSFLNFFKIRKIFKKADIIHVIDIWPNGFYAKLISLGLKKPIIITALGTYSTSPFYTWRRQLMIWTCSSAKIIAISDYTKEKINKILPHLKIRVICPGFNLDFWSSTEVRLQEFPEVGLRYEDYKPYILSVGALKPRKGYHNSIRAFGIVAKQFKNLNYVIIGQGEESDYAKDLKSFIKDNGLENRVFFISSGIDDNKLLEFYRNAELFVLTPIEEDHHFEGFGIVYLEAAASGLPIVATYNSGATSATNDGYNSILVPQNDPQQTAGAIIKILSDNSLRSNLKNNGREWAKNFSWEKIIKSYIEIYNAYAKHN
ncbi:MAG: glycosyltransferase family 4 protein [Candidatus Azambacteria bacterium]|nr:glycosyltransferase family 4 protein [Candidatus Azambacteria bacterium]